MYGKILEYVKKYQDFLIWICLPLFLFILPLITRLFFINGYYFAHANFALSLFILSLIFYHIRHSNLLLFKLGGILALFFLLLTILDSLQFLEVPFAVYLFNIMKTDMGIQEALGITGGFASIFVFLIAIRAGHHIYLSENILQGFRTIAGMAAIFSIIITLGVLGIQGPYAIKWIFQIVLVGGGLFVGIFSFAIGILFGASKDVILSLIGIIVVFVIGLIYGISVIVFTGRGEALFLSQFSFSANISLIIGLVLYTLETTEAPWNKYIKIILGNS